VTDLDPALVRRIDEFARTPVVLVASDYDGTIATIVEDPAAARPRREAVVALRALAALPDTTVAVISGRALRDLATLSRLPEEILLVGSHGSEFDLGTAEDLDVSARDRLDDVVGALEAIVGATPGAHLEVKPASVAMHTRRVVDRGAAEHAVTAALGVARGRDGVWLKQGKEVVELSVIRMEKGDALETIRRRVGASAVCYLGDDVTDEDAFASLRGPDVGIKVGVGATRAAFRVAEPDHAAAVLARLAEQRAAWLRGASLVPIEHHSLLSDGRGVALLAPDARVTWFCAPRPDASPLFAELLGGPTAGHFAVRPNHDGPPLGQHYVGDTLTVETRFAGVTVTDFLAIDPALTSDLHGQTDLVRIVSGTGAVRLELVLRPDYGRLAVSLRPVTEGLVMEGGAEPVVVVSPGVDWELDDDDPGVARALVTLGADPLVIELRVGAADPSRTSAAARRTTTELWWSSWVASLRLPSRHRESVVRSALVLRALCYQPTGGVLAAATTSLPEVLGGVRNWDYRYCWIRDGAMTVDTLLALGSSDEAVAFVHWLSGIVAVSGVERLRPVYSVAGEELRSEAVIDTLPGYGGSRPVRVGNAADQQLQLDVYGSVVDVITKLAEAGCEITDAWWHMVRAMVDVVQRRWFEPDNGIWEVRLPPRRHVHSRVLCWYAVDRAIQLGKLLDRDVANWPQLADAIAIDVVENGWSDTAGAFTSHYDSDDLDAATLLVGLLGLVPASDARFRATVAAVERDLRHTSTVYRYLCDDGLPGREGGFVLCATWLVEAYARIGRLDDAKVLLGQVVDQAGPTGMLTEQYDPVARRALGNVPQAYSHLGLVRAVLALEQAVEHAVESTV
jgi:trehalose-phosphatase